MNAFVYIYYRQYVGTGWALYFQTEKEIENFWEIVRLLFSFLFQILCVSSVYASSES